jgi:DNA-binding transcriptional ArsR family regulator
MDDFKCSRMHADMQVILNYRNLIGQSENSLSAVARLLAIAGNDVRLKILFLLFKENELCPCDLSDILQMSVPAISQHLRKMKDARVVINRREGQTLFYRLNEKETAILMPIFHSMTETVDV